MSIKNILLAKIVFVLVVYLNIAQAQLELNISGGQIRGIPIAIVPFKSLQGNPLPHQIHDIVANDLNASGKFESTPTDSFVSFPSKSEEVYYKDWRRIGSEILVIGEVWSTGNDLYEVRFFIFDIARQQRVVGRRIRNLTNDGLRTAAHIISDTIYQSFLNKPGAFNSQLAYIKKESVSANRYRHRLMISDWDGYGAKEVYASWNPLLSPAWSPDLSKIAFVSFKDGSSIVQVLDIRAGKASIIADFKGINTAPAWSPDGSKLAYSNSKDGNPNLYIYDFRTQQHRQITSHYGIDTEPAWSPDGKSLVFTSSRAGKPQVYRANLMTGAKKRITFNGKENANASFDYKGKNLVIVHEGGAINILEMASKSLISLTNGKFDESPSFSPNGDMVLYASEQNYEPTLMVMSSDGRVQKKLEFISGDVREPTWSLLRK